MTRPLALSAAGGSFATLALQLISEWSGFEKSLPVDPCFCDCPLVSSTFSELRIDWVSLCIGILIGLILGLILEFLVVLRQVWVSSIRRQLLGGGRIRPWFQVC